jgi:hypothetical protein
VRIDAGEVALHVRHRRRIVLGDRHLQQLFGVPQAMGSLIQRSHDLLQTRAFLAQLLGAVRRVPDGRIFQLAAYFRESFGLGVVVKETS